MLFLLGRSPAVAGRGRTAEATAPALLAASLYCLNPASILSSAGCGPNARSEIPPPLVFPKMERQGVCND